MMWPRAGATKTIIHLWGFLTPPPWTEDFLAALEATCLRGAFPPYNFHQYILLLILFHSHIINPCSIEDVSEKCRLTVDLRAVCLVRAMSLWLFSLSSCFSEEKSRPNRFFSWHGLLLEMSTVVITLGMSGNDTSTKNLRRGGQFRTKKIEQRQKNVYRFWYLAAVRILFQSRLRHFNY